MAVRGWGGSVATAIGVAAGAGAAQLGLGYGLGIIAWLPDSDGAREAAWIASLAWATWIAATSVVAGAVTADRLSAEPSSADGGAVTPLSAALWRLALAVAAAVGGLITVALVAVPARAAQRADTFSPQTIAAGYAVVGVLVGLAVAVGALTSRAVAANILFTVGWLWLLAVVAVIDGVAAGRGLASAQLGAWQFTANTEGYWFRNIYLPGFALSLGSAMVIGALAGWPAARRADSRVGVAVSGAVGPLLVAAAYFLAAPRLVGVRAEQLSAYLVAPYAVIAGLAGSVLIAAVRGRSEPPGEPAAGGPGPVPSAAHPAPADHATPATHGSAGREPAAPDAGPDLPDDGYAPARAYAADTVPGPPAETGGARGQAAVPAPAVPAPLWPAEATGGTTAQTGRPRPGRPRRGGGQG